MTAKRPESKGLVICIVAVVPLVIAGIGCSVFSKGGSSNPPVDYPATEVPEVSNPSTESPSVGGLGIGSIMNSERDGATLVYVPAGEFPMGSDMYPEEQPIHPVYLDAFWIDQTEVTNSMYTKCVSEGVCREPIDTGSNTRSSYYGNPEFDKYPVVYVEWEMAKTYCEWAGRKLPTEAQWEKAARGLDGRTYPWGNEAPNKDLLNYNSNIENTTEVGSYKSGQSIYGAYDMAGNVWEWVNDYYQYDYYATLGNNASNPQGPIISDGQRLLRGGGWFNSDEGVRSAIRYENHPERPDYDFGFRCSLSP